MFLELLKQQPVGLPDFRDKIVIIGSAAPGLHDLRPTLLGPSTPGTRILGTALSNLLYGDYLRPVSPLWSLWLGIASALMLAEAPRRRVSQLRRTEERRVGAECVR